MKVYTITGFEGHWPVGTSAIIVAKDRGTRATAAERKSCRRASVEKECGFDNGHIPRS